MAPSSMILATNMDIVVISNLHFIRRLTRVVANANSMNDNEYAVFNGIFNNYFHITRANMIGNRLVSIPRHAIMGRINMRAVIAANMEILTIMYRAYARTMFVRVILNKYVNDHNSNRVEYNNVTIRFVAGTNTMVTVIKILRFGGKFLAILNRRSVTMSFLSFFFYHSICKRRLMVIRYRSFFVDHFNYVRRHYELIVNRSWVFFLLILRCQDKDPLVNFNGRRRNYAFHSTSNVNIIMFGQRSINNYANVLCSNFRRLKVKNAKRYLLFIRKIRKFISGRRATPLAPRRVVMVNARRINFARSAFLLTAINCLSLVNRRTISNLGLVMIA